MQVRRADSDDFDVVTALLEELGRPVVDEHARPQALVVYEDQVADIDALHLIAFDEDERAVGFCSLHFRPRLNHTTDEAWIPDLIVTEDVRGTGVARALLESAEAAARVRGCHQLTLESGTQRKRAHAIYKAAGMVHTGRQYNKEL